MCSIVLSSFSPVSEKCRISDQYCKCLKNIYVCTLFSVVDRCRSGPLQELSTSDFRKVASRGGRNCVWDHQSRGRQNGTEEKSQTKAKVWHRWERSVSLK